MTRLIMAGLVASMMASPLAAQDVRPAQQSAPGPTDERRLFLSEVYELARERSPLLRAAGARAEAATTREGSAGLPPDPALQLGVMNFSIPGFEADMPTSMAPSIQAVQLLPFPGKLGLRESMAEQATAMARAGADETWWTVRARAADAFFRLYEVDRKLEVLGETLDLLKDFQAVARSMYAAGTGRQSDVLRANVEVARMDAEIERMTALRRVAAARLNAVLNRPADTPVPEAVLPSLPAEWPGRDTLRSWAEASRPLLRQQKTGVERARTGQALARRQIWPDVSIGLQYGQRDAGAPGTVRMGSAMIGFSVPVFAGSRQLQERHEAAALESVAEAELAAARADVDARLGELLAELERARTLLALYRDEVLPQADANVESSFSSYRVGAVDFMTLVDARMTTNRYETEYFTLLADYGRAVAELETAVGRALPDAPALMAENR